ncbi:MAG: ABC transporter permease [Phycisphaeraceae bacterium]|jgi:ribose transport system permease protein|nr:ABC transporter permease [Phycisphaeraceae bacterium]
MVKKNLGIFGLLIIIIVVTAMLSDSFLTPVNLKNNLRWVGLYAIISIGQAMVIISGGIDLSVGSVIGMTGCMLPMLLVRAGMPPLLAVPLVLLIGAAIGLSNGLMVTKLRLQPFLVTLCGLFIYRGLARWITGDGTQGFGGGYEGLRTLATGTLGSVPVPGIGWVPVPVPFVIMLVIAVIAAGYLNLTVYGRYLFALGNNETAARYSGINTDRVVIVSYVVCGLLASCAGILFAMDLGSAQPSSLGNFYELYAIAAAVLGGCSLRGGAGSILGVVLGAAVVRVLYNAINMIGVQTQLEFAVIGVAILVGVIADETIRRIASRRRAAREARSAA